MLNINKPISEDWIIVGLGFLLILFYLLFSIPVPTFSWENTEELGEKVLHFSNIGKILIQFGLIWAIAIIGAWVGQKNIRHTLWAFPILYYFAVLVLIVAGNSQIRSINLEAVIFSLLIGLAIGNFFQIPTWFQETISAEFLVKIGLVLLGTNIIFSDILKAGILGLIQAIIVVFSVWYFAYWVCRKLKIDTEMTMMLASAVSICGVSAAIATAGAIQGDNKKLSYIISLVLLTAIPMMILMPYCAAWLGLSEEVTGAWLGGSIDTTGAVVASGSLVGETALKISTVVKFSQNVLLGVAAFLISVYWAYRQPAEQTNENVSLKMIWAKFPKFILGFLAASLFFSFFLNPEIIKNTKDSIKNVQNVLFVLAFIGIGLETRLRDFFNLGNSKPLYAFLLAQFFNIILTLGVAYVLFG